MDFTLKKGKNINYFEAFVLQYKSNRINKETKFISLFVYFGVL